MSLTELMAALTVGALGIGAGMPAVSSLLRSLRLDAAARDLAVEMRRARMEAVTRGAYVGIQFEVSPGGDRWRLYEDGGDRGILASEIASGVDRPLGPLLELKARHEGVRIGIAGGALPRIPPAAGLLSPTDDPITFSGADIFSASPTGETSSGTLYLTDGRALRGVVVYGATGRIRVWRHDGGSGAWRL